MLRLCIINIQKPYTVYVQCQIGSLLAASQPFGHVTPQNKMKFMASSLPSLSLDQPPSCLTLQQDSSICSGGKQEVRNTKHDSPLCKDWR